MFNYKELDPELVEYVAVEEAEALKDGERLFIDIDNLPIVVFKIAGQYFAIADVCSHDNGPVGEGDLEGYEVICPRHGARFDIRTGGVLLLPAVVDIPAYPVRLNNGQIEVGVPVEG
jgi:3-phenylpropionate/trans-cinnamate dioxygenase ferredoxin subunit